MEHIEGSNRLQIKMLCLDQMVEKEAFVRIIDAFIDAIDLKQFDFDYYKLNKEGRPPFHPNVLMKLYLYGYHYGIRSSRKLARACNTNIEVMWLLKELQPSFKTIANFRKSNAKSFREVFRHFVFILKDWKLIEGKTIAIDSFKIRAQNSLKNNFNERKVKRHLTYIDNKIDEYERALTEEEGVNNEEKTVEIKDKIAYQNKKKKNYLNIREQLKEQVDNQLSLTDTDAKAVVFQRNSVKIGYNIQAATDAKYKLFIAMDTGDVNDTKALSPMIKQVKCNLGINSFEVLADKGYHSGREIKACEQNGVTTFISPKQSSSSKSDPAFAMESFEYNEEQDTYTCPAGEVLQTNGRQYHKKLLNGRKSYFVKHYKTKACKTCELLKNCTKSDRGRYIERSEYQEYVTSNNNRVNQNPAYYRQRQQIIEHQFGTLKRHWGFDYVLTRGKENVLAESSLMFIVYNLRRSMSILDFDGLMTKIKTIFSSFLAKRSLINAVNYLTRKLISKYLTTHIQPQHTFSYF